MCYDPKCKLWYCGTYTIIVGDQGTGKSASAVIEMLQANLRGEQVWINSKDIRLPDIKKKDGLLKYDQSLVHQYEVFEDVFEVEEAVIINDESNQEFYCRNSQSLDDLIPKVIRETKKRHWRLILLIQDYSDLDVVFKRQNPMVYRLKDFPFHFVWREKHVKESVEFIDDTPRRVPVSGFERLMEYLNPDNWYYLNRKVWDVYNRRELYSLRVLGSKKERQEKGLKRLQNLAEKKGIIRKKDELSDDLSTGDVELIGFDDIIKQEKERELV